MSDKKTRWVFWAKYSSQFRVDKETPRFADDAGRDAYLKSVGASIFTCYRKLVSEQEFADTVEASVPKPGVAEMAGRTATV